MTLTASIHPTDVGAPYRTVLMQGAARSLSYALYARRRTPDPSAHIFTTADFDASATATTP